MLPTHVFLERETHEIKESGPLDDHTRVRLHCGITVDVYDSEEMYTAQLNKHKRLWSDSKTTCQGCIDKVAPEIKQGVTIQADIPTGLNCECGSPLFIQRQTGLVACTAQGHEFTIPEVLAVGMSLLQRLAKGQI